MARSTKSLTPSQVTRLRKALEREKAKSAALAKSRTDALKQQGATSEVLHAISSSPTNVALVLDTVARYAARLCEASDAVIFLRDGDMLRHAAHFGKIAVSSDGFTLPVSRRLIAGRAVLERKQFHVRDLQVETTRFPDSSRFAQLDGYRANLTTPLISEGKAIGVIVARRTEARPFTKAHAALARTFADQAVIAIENARLFNETKEALERQTATAEILKVIASSPSDVQPVFDAIASSASRLCDASFCVVFRFDGTMISVAADDGRSPGTLDVIRSAYPALPGRQSFSARAIVERRVISVADAQNMPDDPQQAERARAIGYRSILAVPMMKGDSAIGTINVARLEVKPFTDAQTELLKAFADQAVIAIENVRMFNETKEALEHQRASSDILRIVSQSMADSQPAFKAILAAVRRLFGDFDATVWRVEQDRLVAAAVARGGAASSSTAGHSVSIAPDHVYGIAIRERRPVWVDDVAASSEINEVSRQDLLSRNRGAVLLVPFVRDGDCVGAISVSRTEPYRFSEKQVALLKTFADQAVIAVENVRMFNETKEALEQQTAISDVLRVISSSPADVQPVLEAVAVRAATICDASDARIALVEGDQVRHVAGFGDLPPTRVSIPLERGAPIGRAVIDRATVYIPDIQAETGNDFALAREIAEKSGWRSNLVVPLMRKDRAVGAIALRRRDIRPFTPKQISLLQTFADQAAIAIENVRLFNETKEALERQTATAEILKVISSSPTDVQPVFDAIARSAVGLCGGMYGAVFRFDGERNHFVAHHGFSGDALEVMRRRFPLAPQGFLRPVIFERTAVHSPDVLRDSRFANRELAQALGHRGFLGVPMLLDGEPIGAIAVYRREAGPFSDAQIAVLQTFADQAVIAIENVRLFNETKEGLERQTATSEILRVIASSPSDVQPVFDAIAASSMRLLKGQSSAVTRVAGDMIQLVALTSTGEAGDQALRNIFPVPTSNPSSLHAKVARSGEPAIRMDAENDPDMPPQAKEMARARGYRSDLVVPMLQEGAVIGAISVTRREPGDFGEHQVNLLKTFADQAVIAIENVRLFNETKEALERQTATAEILKVIAGSPTDVQPVFEVIVESAVRLCGARFGRVYRYDGSIIEMVAGHGLSAKGVQQIRQVFPRAASDDTIVGRVILTRQPFFLQDVQSDESVPELSRKMIEALDTRSQVTVPMLRSGQSIGAITLGWDAPGAFDDQQVTLLQTFADQAVIAIENVRLFNETKEALDQQTATAGILRVISSSPTSVQPVFEAILQQALRLCDASFGYLSTSDGNAFDLAAQQGLDGEALDAAKKAMHETRVPGPQTALGRLRETKQMVHILDAKAESAYRVRDPRRVAIVELAGARTMLAMPLLRDGDVIGAVVIYRREVRGFSEKQMALLHTFADQAVIAIENVRLFNETKEALERQTATGAILSVISSSPTDVLPVLEAVAENAGRLCDAQDVSILESDGEAFRVAAFRGAPQLKLFDGTRVTRGSVAGRAILDGRLIHVHDITTEREAEFPLSKAAASSAGSRTMLATPLLREGTAIGAIFLRRTDVRPFSAKQIELLQTFADQAVIAIENVRLFNETKEALERQTATADILKVIAASPSDTQPVFDAIVGSVARLFGRKAALRTVESEGLRRRARSYVPEAGEFHGPDVEPLDRASIVGQAVLEGRALQWADTLIEGAAAYGMERAKELAFRSIASAPLMLMGRAIGVISVSSPNPGALSDKQVTLLQTFADQAVIAIENARLFNETKEALERQTAISEILRVISSSPADVQPVLLAVAERAARICAAQFVDIVLAERDTMRVGAAVGDLGRPIGEAVPLDRTTVMGRSIVDRMPVHVADLQSAGDDFPLGQQLALKYGHRTILAVPLVREDRALGTILVRRTDVRLFADKDVAVLKTFADQAAIAIENVRLFNETKEALERQTATGEILRVIASSPSDVQPVFDAIVRSAGRLFNRRASLRLVEQGGIRRRARSESAASDSPDVLPIDHESLAGRVILDAVAQQVTDTLGPDAPPYAKANAHKWDFRANAAAPLIRDNTVIGLISVASPNPGALSDKQMALLATFADQAVIAIENVRLFNETKEALEQQTAISEILRVMSDSPADVLPILDAVVDRSMRICESTDARIFVVDGDKLRYATGRGDVETDWVGLTRPITRGLVMGRAVVDRVPVHVEDLASASETEFPVAREVQRQFGHRTTLAVPLLREGKALGVLLLRRNEVRPFTQKQISLLKTFGDQAAIAIENVRLFTETKEALERQTATGEILRVIASSPSDVQPVFDAIVRSAAKLFDPWVATITTVEGDHMHWKATAAAREADLVMEQTKSIYPLPFDPDRSPSARAIRDRAIVEIPDTASPDTPEFTRRAAQVSGFRAITFVPLAREDKGIGTIILASPQAGSKLTPKQLELVKTFADQAVIAIENVRLFNETTEALERQTATAEVLRVISNSPTDTQPVFEAIAQSGLRLFPGAAVAVALPEGAQVRAAAIATEDPELAAAWRSRFPIPFTRDQMHGAAILDRRLIDVPDADLEVDGPMGPGVRNFLASGNKAITIVPMIRGESAIGAISVIRLVPGPLKPNQIALLQTFADQAVIAIENVRLFNETKEALERQTATAEVLKVISSSPTDVEPVFVAIVRKAVQLSGASRGALYRLNGDLLDLVAHHNQSPEALEALRRAYPMNPNRAQASGRAILSRAVAEIEDVKNDPEYLPGMAAQADLGSLLAVPMLRGDGAPTGVIVIQRSETGPFATRHVELLKTFADQAVIAIENVRLFNETKEALERQTATAEILKVISATPTDVRPVLDAVVSSAARLCEAKDVAITLKEGDQLRYMAHRGEIPTAVQIGQTKQISNDWTAGRAALEGRQIHIRDVLDESEGLGEGARMGKQAGYRTVFATPLLRHGAVIGVIVMRRGEVRPFEPRQIELVNTFVEQAVIAIENVRLFNETNESLERQTATAEILKVIASSPSDVQPVFDAIAASARRLLGGHAALVARRAGDLLELAAFTSTGDAGDSELSRLWPAKITGKGHMGKALLSAAPAWVEDIETDPGYSEEFRAGARARGMRSAVSVPMLREGEAIGVISVNRSIPGRFSDHQTNLLKTFADQALIAIENVRLFNETQEALARQEAATQVLRAISESVSDTAPVFTAILDCCNRLIPSIDYVQVQLIEGADRVRLVDHRFGQVRGAAPGKQEERKAELMAREAAHFPRPLAGSTLERALQQGRVVILADTLDGPDTPPGTLVEARRWGHSYSQITVPLMREGRCIGAIEAFRRQLGGFEAKESSLLESFADQAVIAIENVRLFKELEAQTAALSRSVGQLTALGEVGQAISSTLDLETVLKTIATHAVRLTGLDGASIYEYGEASEEFRLQVADSFPEEFLQAIRSAPIRKGDGTVGRVAITLEPIQVPDILAESYRSSRKELLVAAGYRAILTVPLLREGHIIGALNVTRKMPGPFAEETVELLKTFATQSAMAIQNARLFREIAEKGKELEEASRHKSQFLASMSHELRTPLNAILGFNEMILGDIYGEVPADMKEPLTDIQTSGKHLLRLINNVLDLAKIEAGRMELAIDEYSVHDTVEGVRSTLRPLAEAKGLELAVDVPPDIPLARGDGGRIMQCLMNLAGNSLKFTKQGSVGISVALENGTLTYRVTDTGIGIPPDKIGGLFTEFKQTDATIASEYGGTGLGLSITKKFIEMHGGRIWAESEPGSGSTFVFEVPLRAGEEQET